MLNTCARGGPLEPPIEQDLLLLSRDNSSKEDDDNGNNNGGHTSTITFYIREWVPPGRNPTIAATLDAFEAAHPVQREWVRSAKELANQRSFRYVGLCVDKEPYWRLEEDGAGAGAVATQGTTTRLINFMRELAPSEEWRSYEICGLQVQTSRPRSMPLEAMLENCGWRELADRMQGVVEPWTPLPINLSRTMLLKKANTEVAPIEAALIHCSFMGSATLNSASYGGLDTLISPIVIPPGLAEVRDGVARAADPFPQPQAEFDLRVLGRARELYTLAAGALAIPLSPQLLAASALYAAAPGRVLHVLKDITLEDVQGQATRFGEFAGPGLSSFRSAMAWAKGSINNGDNDDNADTNAAATNAAAAVNAIPAAANANAAATTELATLRSLGASADLFPLNRRQRSADLQLFCTLLRNVALVRQERYAVRCSCCTLPWCTSAW